MTLPSGQLVLLDTDVLIHLARNDSDGKALEARYKLSSRTERPLYSTITEGELRAFAKYRNWGPEKLHRLDSILSQLVRTEASLPQVVEAYADLYAAARRGGHPHQKQNDLWIAATAKAADAVVLTADRDFEWMHPEFVRVIRVLPTQDGSRTNRSLP